jgi:hypothetical protein
MSISESLLDLPLLERLKQRDEPLRIKDAIEMLHGKGYFQWLAFPAMLMTYALGGFFFYAIPLYQYYPKLLCTGVDGEEFGCERKVACSEMYDDSFKVDRHHPETFANWITELDLVCAPGY